MSVGQRVPANVLVALAVLAALILVAVSIALPGGPAVVAVALFALRANLARRGELGARMATALLIVALVAVVVQAVVLSSYAVSGGGEQGSPMPVTR